MCMYSAYGGRLDLGGLCHSNGVRLSTSGIVLGLGLRCYGQKCRFGVCIVVLCRSHLLTAVHSSIFTLLQLLCTPPSVCTIKHRVMAAYGVQAKESKSAQHEY